MAGAVVVISLSLRVELGELVVLHAPSVVLQVGLQAEKHRGERRPRLVLDVVELLGIGLEVVEGGDFLPIEVQGVVPLDHLVDAVHILHDEAGALRVEGVTTEGHHRLVVPDEVEDRGK